MCRIGMMWCRRGGEGCPENRQRVPEFTPARALQLPLLGIAEEVERGAAQALRCASPYMSARYLKSRVAGQQAWGRKAQG